MKYHFRVHKEGRGYWAECVELQGCRTEADTTVELAKNMREALNLFLDEPPSSSHVFPLPKKRLAGRSLVEVPVSPPIAFATYLKAMRHARALTQKETATLLGFKNLYSYQRLESSKSANPELATLAKIKSVFPDFDLGSIIP